MLVLRLRILPSHTPLYYTRRQNKIRVCFHLDSSCNEKQSLSHASHHPLRKSLHAILRKWVQRCLNTSRFMSIPLTVFEIPGFGKIKKIKTFPVTRGSASTELSCVDSQYPLQTNTCKPISFRPESNIFENPST